MQLEHQETLHTIAEIAVVLAGFTGIVTIFGAKSAPWSPGDKMRLRQLLRSSLTAIFCSFFPTLLSFLLESSTQVWKTSCFVIALIMTTNISRFWFQSRREDLSKSQRANAAFGVVVVVALFIASLGEALDPTFAVIAALLWQLFIASHNFVLLLTSYISDDG